MVSTTGNVPLLNDTILTYILIFKKYLFHYSIFFVLKIKVYTEYPIYLYHLILL
jgi:hypothetical protein